MTERAAPRHPFLHLREVASGAACARWCAAADRGIAEARGAVGDGADWSASSSSLRLRGVAEIEPDEVWRIVWRDPLRSACAALLGRRLVCDLDQAWVRRQYAPAHAPPLHHPHVWHQDGALGFDFLTHAGQPFPADALLEMVTAWIALVPCGVDAPGLELVAQPPGAMLTPTELMADRVDARFAPDRLHRPALAAGDALVFRGDILHRTHVAPAMTRDRTSLELRFFAADRIPARLRGERFSRPACDPRSAP